MAIATDITTFRRGAKCVCIKGSGAWRNTHDTSLKIDGPAYGDRLTVHSVQYLPHGVFLEFAKWPGMCFRAGAFRPLVERTQEQDVALFAHHLKSAVVGGEAVAA